MFSEEFIIAPQHIWAVYKNLIFESVIDNWSHTFPRYSWFKKNTYHIISIPLNQQTLSIISQEVLTADNIAFRFSFNVDFHFKNIEAILENFDFRSRNTNWKYTIEYSKLINAIRDSAKSLIRNNIAQIEAINVSESRDSITNGITEALNNEFEVKWIHIKSVSLVDITFPKFIQETFAKKLESEMQASIQLENAKTQVATARTLKNAAKLMNESPEIQYLQYLETLKEISKRWSHTFTIDQIKK